MFFVIIYWYVAQGCNSSDHGGYVGLLIKTRWFYVCYNRIGLL